MKGPAGNAGDRCRSGGDRVARNRFVSGQVGRVYEFNLRFKSVNFDSAKTPTATIHAFQESGGCTNTFVERLGDEGRPVSWVTVCVVRIGHRWYLESGLSKVQRILWRFSWHTYRIRRCSVATSRNAPAGDSPVSLTLFLLGMDASAYGVAAGREETSTEVSGKGGEIREKKGDRYRESSMSSTCVH